MYGEQVVFLIFMFRKTFNLNISTQDTQSDEQTTENEIISLMIFQQILIKLKVI